MSLLSAEELKTLVEQPQGLCVSIYMPTYRTGAEVQQNPIRYKNLLREAEERLQETGMSEQEAREFLQPAAEKLDESLFWERQSDGLAIFLADGTFHSYRMPLNFEELVALSNHFHLKPLLPLLTSDGRFYILALSQKQVRLLECTRYSVREVELENLPKSMESALLYDETAKDSQFRMGTSKGGTANAFQQPGTFHGQGSPDSDDIKRNILQYFHIINKGVHDKYLRQDKAPMVLAGVEYVLPIYREANTYQHLVSEGMAGNAEILNNEELHAQAWPLVEPLFMEAQQKAIERYKQLAGTGLTSTDVKEALPAAHYGRVEQLFVGVGAHKWGVYNPEDSTLQLHPDPEAGDEDLLDTVAIETILHGGTVYAVAPDKVPDEAPLAAVFRY
ncbi:MAG: hypothetical protein KME26_07100 [Oscillatoria princeps RMCB-10]|jgi:hypothetical protein|nr:hypothetical protein [Oscillatoria princeps RMCB-10]